MVLLRNAWAYTFLFHLQPPGLLKVWVLPMRIYLPVPQKLFIQTGLLGIASQIIGEYVCEFHRKKQVENAEWSPGLMAPALWQEFVRFTVCEEWNRHRQHCFTCIFMKQDPKPKIFLRHYPCEIYAVRSSYYD